MVVYKYRNLDDDSNNRGFSFEERFKVAQELMFYWAEKAVKCEMAIKDDVIYIMIHRINMNNLKMRWNNRLNITEEGVGNFEKRG